MRLAAPKGEFALPDPPPAKILFVTCGQRHHPGDGDAAFAQGARGSRPDIVHIHSAPSAEAVIFHDELRELEATQPGYRLHLQLTDEDGKVDFETSTTWYPDWTERPDVGVRSARDARHRGIGVGCRGTVGVPCTWSGSPSRAPIRAARVAPSPSRSRTRPIDIDGATSLLEAGEKVGIQMPFGCRMGICQTCVLPLESGYVRDFRSGDEHGAGDRIQTCISAASGDCTIKI